ncbi:MAG: hypothetical protein ACTSVV_14830 [Promethearchaeota archaeon]
MNFIKNQIDTLNSQLKINLNEQFQKECIQIYDDILNSISYNSERENFIYFYKNFGSRSVKSSNYVAASLIFFNLARLGNRVNKTSLANILNLNLSSLNRVCNYMLQYLRRLTNYDFVLELINPNKLSRKEYYKLIFKYINDYIFFLKYGKDVSKQIYLIFLEIIHSINGDDNFKIFYSNLKRKHPRILAAVLCFIFLKYEKDLKLKKKDFLDLLLENKEINIPRTNFTEVLHQIISEFYAIDKNKYWMKVEDYFIQYLYKFISYLIKKSKIDNDCDYLRSLIKNMLSKAITISNQAFEQGFKIIEFNLNNEVDYYFPQDFAFSLLYYTFKTTNGLEDMVSPSKFEECFKTEFKFRHVNDKTSNRLYPFIANVVERYKRQVYIKETFIEMMQRSLNEFYHFETDFLLRLFKIVNMDPVEFGNKLYIHNTPGTSGILRVIRKRISFTEPQTFSNLRRFIKENLDEINQNIFLKWINNIQKSKRRDFIHQSVTYPFRWNEDRLKNINNDFIARLLYIYLFNVWQENFPREIFMSSENPRASMLKFFGTREEPILVRELKSFFINSLKKYNSNFFLCQHVQYIFDIYKNFKMGRNPDHNSVLNNIFINCNEAIGVEIPVWKPINNSNLCYIGHIDLLLYYEDRLIIADYKLNEEGIFRALPQLTAYAKMIKDRLERLGDTHLNNNFICIGFSKDLAYAFNPDTLFPKILQFVKLMDSQRKNILLSRKVPKKSGRTRLFNDLLKLN